LNGTRITKGMRAGGWGAVALLAALSALPAAAQNGIFPGDRPPPPGSLKGMPAPLPANLDEFVVNRKAAIVLGKALFWDQQAGSDGLACASCHFQAGADNRVRNTLSPGLRNETNSTVNTTFNQTASNRNTPNSPTNTPPNGGGGPNYILKKGDFPFHQLADTTNRNSAVIADSDDVVSSQGVYHRDFVFLLSAPQKHDACMIGPSAFNVGGVNVRQAEPRNTPTVINAVFNFRNFWDGRANNIFNGRNPFGPRDATAGVDLYNSVMASDAYGNLAPYPVAMADASLASQSVGPPLSNFEMSCGGRLFEHIGQKMLHLKPLNGQLTDPTDSVLGPYAGKLTGLTIDYPTLIKQAFQPKFWNSGNLTGDGYTQMEKNFSLYWAVSIMLYESTLVSDKTPFDQYMSGDITAMTTQQVSGFTGVFMGKGGCVFCHRGAEFTGAATSQKLARSLGAQVENMLMGDGKAAVYDTGFYNIGVRPPVEDIGIGGGDPYGYPLSWSRQAKNAAALTGPQTNLLNIGPDMFNVFTCNFEVSLCSPIASDMRDAVDGSFKVPSLRNVELTGPYFHNGGQATLEQVVEFYNRGGDSKGDFGINTTGYKNNPSNLPPEIMPLNLSGTEKANLVAFLKSLTDERVRWEQAPFDHPSLKVPNGHPYNEFVVLGIGPLKQAVDEYIAVPAVGAAGRSAKLGPLKPFDAGLQ
jgi:cytochrome c peroxidase